MTINCRTTIYNLTKLISCNFVIAVKNPGTVFFKNANAIADSSDTKN